MKNYLDDYDATISWAVGMAGFALVCETIALQDLADSTTVTTSEAEERRDDFSSNVPAALDVAYEQFPAFVKQFKPNYQTNGTNLGQWFRMWRSGVHVKNFVGWTGDGNGVDKQYDVGSNAPNEHDAVFQIYPIACDDDEGLYPELEFRFNENTIP
ncbi:hypothetical protein ACHAPU_002712 [Fusarium lateritium]